MYAWAIAIDPKDPAMKVRAAVAHKAGAPLAIEMVDLEGPDANARISLPTSDKLVLVEIIREKDGIAFTCDGQSQKAFHASGKLRGEEARTSLLATDLRPGFSVKKGGKASFRNAQIIKP